VNRPVSVSAGLGQRLLALVVFVAVAALIWLAYTGRYDADVNHVAAWLHRHWDALRH
jgi:hypothetical protein